jgi:hypothetical protein
MTEDLGRVPGGRTASSPWRIVITTSVLVAMVIVYALITAPSGYPPPSEYPPPNENAAERRVRRGCEQTIDRNGRYERATRAWKDQVLRCVKGKRAQ